MAKVKDQVLPGSDVSYIDAQGITHYDIDLIKHIMPNAYPLPSLNPTGVARKSSRNHRPPGQGVGSHDQQPWRSCFRQCADAWNAMPEECPAFVGCKGCGSKKTARDAKSGQGVMCSAYDLYMGCCLKTCVEMGITWGGGAEITGGVIDPCTNCWPCPPDCGQGELSISYTTLRMMPCSFQSLGVNDSEIGDAGPCCPNGDFVWTVWRSDGYIYTEMGESIIIQALCDFIGCQANMLIKVVDCCGREASISITVNKSTITDTPAYSVREEGPLTCPECWSYSWEATCGLLFIDQDYNCAGDKLDTYTAGKVDFTHCAYFSPYIPGDCITQCDCGACHDACILLIDPPLGTITDKRTPEMIADNCCPPPF
jgi:hypothetical protein